MLKKIKESGIRKGFHRRWGGELDALKLWHVSNEEEKIRR